MRRASFGILLTFFLSGCGPPLVWGGNDATKDRLLKIVPIGATVRDLETEVAARDWRISSRDDRRFTKGESHYFGDGRSEEHTSELQSLMRISYAVFCFNKKIEDSR